MASSRRELTGDLCILGSGMAGMLLAERALARGRRVLMIERGEALSHADRLRAGSHADRLRFNRSRTLSAHEPPPEGPAEMSRHYRFEPVYNLGGSTNHFLGNMPRRHPAHFSQPALGGLDRRWPFGYDELEPYYLQVEERLAISGSSERTPFAGRFAYPLPPHRASPMDRACEALFGRDAVMPMPTMRPSRAVGSRPRCCGSNHCSLCPVDAKGTALNTVYPSIVDRIELHCGLLATEVECTGGAVRAVSGVDAEGNPWRLRAEQFVVACNGVDSPLLLLRSPSVPHHETLGRCYMDHPFLAFAVWAPGVEALPGYGDTIYSGMITTFFERAGEDLPVSLFGDIAGGTLAAVGPGRDRLLGHVLARSLAAARPGKSLRERFAEDFRGLLEISFLVETQPLLENSVAIRAIRPSGQAIPKVTLRYPAYLAECARRIRDEIRRHAPGAEIVHTATGPGAHHWLGATRMAESARHGCVDGSLRYHGLANLFVLSGSTFPSSSSASPTMTIAALALRLGDHLA